MSELEKLKERLKSLPKDFSYNEAKSLLIKLGFEEIKKGKTSGSRVKFQKKNENILLHKPHGKKNLDPAFVKFLLKALKESGYIEE